MTNETLGQRIARIRNEKKYSQKELSEACALDQAYISLIEHDRRVPSLKAVRRIARALGVNSEYLETGNPTMQYVGYFSNEGQLVRVGADAHKPVIDFPDEYGDQTVRVTVEVLTS